MQSPAGVVRPQVVKLALAESKLDAKIELEDGVEVAGTVTAEADGQPIAEVTVIAITPGEFLQMRMGSARTDPQGRFSMRLPSGQAKLYFGGVPRGFDYPKPEIVATLEVTRDDGDLQKLRLQLHRTK